MRLVIAMLGLTVMLTACGSAPTAAVSSSPLPSPSPSPTASAAPSYPGLWPRTADLAFDSTRGNLVLFGGLAQVPAGDTWVWQGHRWVQQHPTASPSARQGAALADDPEQHALVLFGGAADSGTPLRDTWAWNGTTWVLLAPAHSPPARIGAAMTFDPVRHVVLMFGGSGGLNDTWIWNGLDWSQASPAQSPPSRMFGRLAVDVAHGDAILFGGFGALNDTWSWDGVNWTEKHPGTTPPGFSAATPFAQQMVYDSARGVVMFAGPTQHSALSADDTMDTWTWSGTDWTHLSPAASPPARDGSGLAYDSANSTAILAGGFPLGKADTSATWAWDGSNWAAIG